MLPLHGTATFCNGLDQSPGSVVIRFRGQSAPAGHSDCDFVLVAPGEEGRSTPTSCTDGAVIISDQVAPDSPRTARAVGLPRQFSYLKQGDIIAIHPKTKRFRTLYRRASKHNSFLVTERCNHYCLMCSQPPKDVDDRWILKEIRSAIPLIDPETRSLGFTGGEPLLDWQDFLGVLADCRDTLPGTAIHVLSNGRAFAHDAVVDAWTGLGHPNLTVGIPIYAAVDHIHDYVVQAAGAFDETVLGILKLKDRKQRVEIRVVLHALTTPHMLDTCRWIARNLSFADHVALMGLENTGFAIANEKLLWVDPSDYRDELAEAVDMLVAARVPVSVYNLQRCVLARSVWPFAAQSISDWKNEFVKECDGCCEMSRCTGFFSSGRPRQSRAIRPILVAAD
jgi:His-Xaa-Ser system radical SAM maturase HxsC